MIIDSILKSESSDSVNFIEKSDQRPRPHLDNKILTSWNGLMISGFAVSGMALLQKRPEYIEIAVQAAEFIRFAYARGDNWECSGISKSLCFVESTLFDGLL